jgi:hypothetical protein
MGLKINARRLHMSLERQVSKVLPARKSWRLNSKHGTLPDWWHHGSESLSRLLVSIITFKNQVSFLKFFLWEIMCN